MFGRGRRRMSNLSQAVKQSINGDEYYSPQNAVDMIVPYILGGGINQYGVLLTRQKVILLRHFRVMV